MSRRLRAAALQCNAHDRTDFEAFQKGLLERVAAAAQSCDLLVLPEGTLPAYVLGDARVDDAAIGSALHELQSIARLHTCVIVAGTAVRHEGKLYNSAAIIDRDGTIAGRAEKIFLWHFDRKWFTPGEHLAPVRTSIGTLGALICADGRMPGIASALVDRGAEVLVMPTAWVTSGRDPEHLENAQADLLARVRAFENGVPFIAANKCGVEMGMVAYCGKSQIIDANGTIVARAGEREEGAIFAEIELGTAAPMRASFSTPAPPLGANARALRLAISVDPLPYDVDARLEILDADFAIGPDRAQDLTYLQQLVAIARIDARVAFDPSALVAYREAGYSAIILDAQETHPWLERLARARALELRLYVIVLDRAHRAYAIDPDGVVIAGSYDGYTIASFALDPARTRQTSVAPGTDIAQGIKRVAALAAREPSA